MIPLDMTPDETQAALADARRLPTAVLEQVLRERKAAAKKTRKFARDRRDGYLVALTEDDKQAILDAWDRVKETPFRDTRGRRATYPRLNHDKSAIVDVPVVVLGEHNGQYITRLSQTATTLLPADWPIEFVNDDEWLSALAVDEARELETLR